MKLAQLLRSAPPLWTATFLALGLLALGLLAPSCKEGSSEVDVQTENLSAGSGSIGSAAILAQLPHAAQVSVLHSGVRVFQSQDWSTDTPHLTKFREQIFSDGQGQYAIVPLDEIEGTLPDWTVFRMIQEIRQGLNFKYRDFATRDPIQFLKNWQLVAIPGQKFVAGVLCSLYRIDRLVGEARTYTISVDPNTGLILRYREEDSLGRTVSLLEYETVDYAPDFSSVVWYDESVREQIDLARGMEEQVGFKPMIPSLLPEGYALRKAEVAELEGGQWLSMEYTDGVDTLFFVQRFPFLQRYGAGSAVSGGSSHSLGKADKIFSTRIGAAWALQGNVSDRGVIVVGKATEVELLDMLQSALD